jgi:hypothetical protein
MDEPMTDDRTPEEADLTRLADGSLPADRQSELRARIAQSPPLAAALAEQEHAVTLLRAIDTPAPASLRAQLDELTGTGERRAATRRRQAPRWRRALVLPGATALAAVVAAIVVLVGGGASAPTVPQAARLALASATLPAPAVDPDQSKNLSLEVAGIPVPAWGHKAGWVASGARTDTVNGRRIATVFYDAPNGKRIGYAISTGAPLSGVHGQTISRDGVRFTLQQVGSARLISWVRSGHTCVIAGRSVSDRTLLRLASAEAAESIDSQAVVASSYV